MRLFLTAALLLTLSIAACGDNTPPQSPPPSCDGGQAGQDGSMNMGGQGGTATLPACADHISYGYCSNADSTAWLKDSAGNFIGAADGYSGTPDDPAAWTPFTPEQAAAFTPCNIAKDGFGQSIDLVGTSCPQN